MKSRIFLFAAALFACSFSIAQETVVEEFNPHWYLQLQGGAGYTVGETNFKDLLSPAAQLGIGYQFTPSVGLRFAADGWQAKGAWVLPSEVAYKFNYAGANLDLMINLCNALGGYKPHRVFNFSPFIGIGGVYAFNNDEANNTYVGYGVTYTPEYLWSGHQLGFVGRGGFDVDFNITDRFAIGLEANANATTDRFNSKRAGDKNVDWQFNALLGVKFALGNPVKKTVIALPVAPEPEPEPAKVVEPVKPEPKPAVVVPEDIRRDIFFAIRSHDFSQESINKLNDIVVYMQKYPEAKVSVSTYADVKTGNPKINQGYAEARRKAVVDYLVQKGVSASRINSSSYGDTVQPFDNNDDNRAAVCIATVK